MLKCQTIADPVQSNTSKVSVFSSRIAEKPLAPLEFENKFPVEDIFDRFTHPLQVQVLRFPATKGVLFKYAESAELNLKLRLIW